MKNKLYLPVAFLFFLILSACSSDDDSSTTSELVVAFKNESINLDNATTEKEVELVFSDEVQQDGNISITYTEHNLSEGNDFSTLPSVESGVIQLPVEAGTSGTSFTFNKLTDNPTNGEEKAVEFLISEISLPNAFTQGNTSIRLNFAEGASASGNLNPEVGGPNEGNQVYVDLSTQQETVVYREIWDLAFYSGDDFRVKLNPSLYMMAMELESTNIDEITETDVENLQPEMAFLTPGAENYVDAPSGNIDSTAIAAISSTPEENKVYLLKMGNEVGTDTPETGSVAVAGESRGWKKIRILREGENYLLQYADLDATSHTEVTISKNETFNFSFFSLISENEVEVEPQKTNWDLNFTVFTEVLDLPEGGMSAYGYSDYITTNVLSDVKAYQVETAEIAYEDFSAENIEENLFEIDQRVIGANWRDVFEGLHNDRFYVLEDTEGNRYKIKFTAMLNSNGVRGYPKFQYELLN